MRGVVGSWWEAGLIGASGMPFTIRNMPQQRIMTWARVLRSLRKLAAYCSLMCFSSLLVAKLGGSIQLTWWWVFFPLWVFHAIIARGSFSIPAPSPPHDRHWAPCHAVAAVPFLLSFELLICTYLYSMEVSNRPLLSLKLVFLPLLGLELLILIDNFRMCRALMPADEESLTDEIIWETLPHFWISVSMVFFIAATVFTLLKLTGEFSSLGWWDLFINYAIAECFTFLVCTKWSNNVIREVTPSTSTKTLERIESDSSASSTSVTVEDDSMEAGFCGMEDIGGHILKVPLLISQILLCMKLEGTPAKAANIPVSIVAMPLMLVVGLAILLTLLRVVERLLMIMHVGDESRGGPLRIFSKLQEIFGFIHHGSRLLGWWSIDEKSKEEQVRLLSAHSSGYYTFTGPSPDVVKKMARKDLAEEIWRLQAALGEQTQIAKHQQHEFDRLQNEKVLCRVCFERDIAVVLLPCKHRVLCSLCSERLRLCPICRSYVDDRMSVFDV